MKQLPEEVLRHAAARHGVVTADELAAAGWSEMTIRWQSRSWAQILPGIFSIDARAGTDPGSLPFLTRVWAGLLHAGEGAAVGGASAAYLWKVSDIQPDLVEIAVPRDRRVPPAPGWRFTRHREHIHLTARPGEPTMVRVEDVVLDLVGRARSSRTAASWLLDACQRGRTTAPMLRQRLDGRRRLRHRALAEAVLADIATGTTTQLERHYLLHVERAHGLPASVRQLLVPGTRRLADLGYEEYLTLIELDGRRGHSEDDAFRDMDRDNAHALLSWTTLRYGWRQVIHGPCRIALQVQEVLRRHGWRGTITPCPRCVGTLRGAA